MNVEISEQVAEFIRRLPPQPRQRLRPELRDLADEKGDIKPLEAPLEEYCRLRVGAYRIVFTYAGSGPFSASSPSAGASFTSCSFTSWNLDERVEATRF